MINQRFLFLYFLFFSKVSYFREVPKEVPKKEKRDYCLSF
nr:MAG TPA: hypothetical protein [Caudoviricetes sp.]